MTFDSIILDIDGTIWDTTDIVAQAWNDAVRPYNAEMAYITASHLKKEFGKTMDVIAMDLWPSLPEETRTQLLKECCRLEHIAVEKNNNDITFPGVVDTVKKLGSNIDFYVVSNCQKGYIPQTLKKTGLSPFIKDSECYGNTGLGKADNIKLVIQRNNLKKPLYIGDTQGDCDACKQSGVPFVWASYGFGSADSYFAKLDKFEDIIEIIK